MGIEKIPLIIPEKWDPTWFRMFINEVLAPLDTRNSIGVGVDVISDGNSVATLDVTDTIDTAIDAHNALATAHAAAFDVHRAETDPHPDLIDDLPTATAITESDVLIVSQAGTNRQATVDQLTEGVFGDDWDDMMMEANGINLLGASTDPSRQTATGLLSFSGSQDNVIGGSVQLSHQWRAGTAVRPHLHLRFPTAATAKATRWMLEYDVATPNGNFANAEGTYTTLTSITATNPADTTKHALFSFGDLPMTGKAESSVILWRISRLAASDAADDDTNACTLLSLDFHYRKNKAGTNDEIPSP